MTREMGAPQRDVFGATLVALGRTDPRIVVLDGDLANSTKTDMFEAAHPDRFIETGLAEQNMMGAAAGLAAMGYVPFISTFACFAVCRTLDQVRVLVAQTRLNVKIVGSYGGLLVGLNGKTHQVLDDFAVMRAMPNMVVLAPADAEETRQVVEAAARTDGPMYIRLTRDAGPVVFGAEYPPGHQAQRLKLTAGFARACRKTRKIKNIVS
jgi:transketolase